MANISPVGVISFPALFTARLPAANAQPGSERFSVNLLWNAEAQASDEYAKLRKHIMEAATEKWGAKAADMFKSGALRTPLRDAGEKEYAGYEPGMTYANFWSKQRPGIVDAKLEDVIDQSYAFPGALGRVSYRAFAYDASGNRGVALGLLNVQITDITTPRLDGRAAPQKEFDAVVGSGGSSSSAGDDDFPF